MSSEIKPMATSTPNPVAVKSSVLQEKQLNGDGNKDPRRRPLQKKINFGSRSGYKENFSKDPPRRRSEGDDKKEALKRQQALEAMQILEQRRHRMTQQNLADDLQELSLESPVELRDAAEEKKRLEAKRAKEKKIKAVLAEQEARKKKDEVKKLSWSIHRPIHPPCSSYRQKNHVSFKPKPSKLPEVEDKEPKDPVLHIPKQCPTSKSSEPPQKVFIRYSKDDLRALNPYGYYFMWSATFTSLPHHIYLFLNIVPSLATLWFVNQ